MFKTTAFSLVIATSLALAVPATTSRLSPVNLEQIEHVEAELSVSGANGEFTFTPEDLENLGSYALTTTTPWRDEAAVFEGARLVDVLAAAGLLDAAELLVVAENDYEVRIPRAVWQNTDILLATRVNGQPHTRRARGPIQFVMPMDAYSPDPEYMERYWVWMAARISPAQ